MAINCLGYAVYDEKGWDWSHISIENPRWYEVSTAVHRLDKFRYPFIFLFISEDYEDQDSTVNCLTIMGGKGVFWVSLYTDKYSDGIYLFDPNRGNDVVELWTSDQGFHDYEFHTTDDIDLIMSIAEHFGKTGEPLPSVTWVKDYNGEILEL